MIFKAQKKIPIFCYHSLTAYGTAYHENDHTALESDLKSLKNEGYRAISINDTVAFIRGKKNFSRSDKVFLLTFDDAPYWDYFNYSDNVLGTVKSFAQIIKESGMFTSDNRPVSFAIASEEARNILDKTCIAGRGEWDSSWWEKSIDQGIFEVANHSWDHVHPTLDKVCQRNNHKGDFSLIKTYDDANLQIREANIEIKRIVNSKNSNYFAYPYGHVSDYLKNTYFPNYTKEHNIIAAFSTGGRFATKKDSIWDIPRLVCGEHWKSSQEFIKIITAG